MVARRIAWIVVGAVLFVAPSVFAQSEFVEFLSKEDHFAANFPGTPVVSNITWETEYGAKIPARAYTVTDKVRQGPRRYVATVIDYSPVRQILTERAKDCDPRDERCGGTFPLEGVGYWKNDLRGAMMFAASKWITSYEYHVMDYHWNYLGGQGIEVNQLQVINLKDKALTHISIYMHHNRLYVLEETVPAGYPPPGLFVQSIGLKETDGSNARHFGVYFNGPTVDPIEAKACTAGGGGGQANTGAPRVNACKTLPADVRFQQGPNFNVDDTEATQPREPRPAAAQ